MHLVLDALPDAAHDAPLRRTTILGVGSPYGDDRAGWLVIERLDAAGAQPGVTTLALDRPGAALLEHLRDVDRAIVIDALRSGAAPGTIQRLDTADLYAQAQLSTHEIGVAQALALGARLGRLPSEVIVFGIEADPEATGAGVSAAVQRAAATLAAQLDGYLTRAVTLRLDAAGC